MSKKLIRPILCLLLLFSICISAQAKNEPWKPSDELGKLIYLGDIDTLREKLLLGYNFVSQYTPLYYACMYNKMNIVIMMIEEFNVDINKSRRAVLAELNEDTPLLEAIYYSNIEIVKYLIEKGATVKEKSLNDDFAPLLSAVSCVDDSNLDIIKMIVERGASVEVVDTRSITPLIYTCILPNRMAMFRYFLDKGANAFRFDYFNQNILHTIGTSNNVAAFEELIKRYGKKVRPLLFLYDNSGMQPIHVAGMRKSPEIIKKYLEQGVDPNVRIDEAKVKDPNKRRSLGDNGHTPLMLALIPIKIDNASSVLKSVQILIEAGADCTKLKDLKQGMTAFLIAADHPYTSEPLALMLKLGKYDFKNKDNNGVGALGFAARSNVENVKILVAYGANINEVYGKEKITPLYLAIKYSNVEAVRYLLSLKALQLDVPSGATWDYRNYAAAMGNEEIKKLIMAAFEQRQK